MENPLARAALDAMAAAAQVSIEHGDDPSKVEAARQAARDAIDEALAAGVTSEEIWNAASA
ncbi:hypothetical protein ACFVXG_20380 [Kitasatospora sp. NPDC058162]|uniref:hypothetical protein n=1 Tax=Kitasatospora sp. NPDC058162 TaxID=3346362 RepID=UPI0036D78D36